MSRKGRRNRQQRQDNTHHEQKGNTDEIRRPLKKRREDSIYQYENEVIVQKDWPNIRKRLNTIDLSDQPAIVSLLDDLHNLRMNIFKLRFNNYEASQYAGLYKEVNHRFDSLYQQSREPYIIKSDRAWFEFEYISDSKSKSLFKHAHRKTYKRRLNSKLATMEMESRPSKLNWFWKLSKPISHPNVIDIFGIYEVQNKTFVMKHALQDYPLLVNPYNLHIFTPFRQLIDGLDHFHKNGLFFNPLTSQNVKFDGITLVLDPLDSIVDEDTMILNESEDSINIYFSPERRVGNRGNLHEDNMYSCGVLLLRNFREHHGRPRLISTDQIEMVENRKLEKVIKDLGLQEITQNRQSLCDLIESLVCSNKRRLTLNEVRQHRWLNPKYCSSNYIINYSIFTIYSSRGNFSFSCSGILVHDNLILTSYDVLHHIVQHNSSITDLWVEACEDGGLNHYPYPTRARVIDVLSIFQIQDEHIISEWPSLKDYPLGYILLVIESNYVFPVSKDDVDVNVNGQLISPEHDIVVRSKYISSSNTLQSAKQVQSNANQAERDDVEIKNNKLVELCIGRNESVKVFLMLNKVWSKVENIIDGFKSTVKRLYDDTFNDTWLHDGALRETVKNYKETHGIFGLKEVRLVVLGDTKVGKTSLLRALQGLDINPDHISTVSADFEILRLKLKDSVKELEKCEQLHFKNAIISSVVINSDEKNEDFSYERVEVVNDSLVIDEVNNIEFHHVSSNNVTDSNDSKPKKRKRVKKNQTKNQKVETKREETPVETDEDVIRLNVWDFGGQYDYLHTHQMFIGGKALYLVLISNKENDKSHVKQLNLWIGTILALHPDAIIGVILNKCDDGVRAYDISKLDELEKYVKSEVLPKCRFDKQIKFVVACSSLKRVRMDKIITELEANSRTLLTQSDGSIGVPYPVLWVKLLEQIRGYNDYLNWSDVILCGKRIGMQEKEIQRALDRFNLLSDLLYYPDNGHLVISHPMWLVKVLRCIIIARENRKNWLNTPELTNAFSILEINKAIDGQMSSKFIYTLWRINGYINDDNLYEKLIHIMIKFDLAVKLNEVGDQLLIPALLPNEFTPPKQLINPLKFILTMNYIPVGLFSRLVVRFMKMKKHNSTYLIALNRAYIHTANWNLAEMILESDNQVLRCSVEDRRLLLKILKDISDILPISEVKPDRNPNDEVTNNVIDKVKCKIECGYEKCNGYFDVYVHNNITSLKCDGEKHHNRKVGLPRRWQQLYAYKEGSIDVSLENRSRSKLEALTSTEEFLTEKWLQDASINAQSVCLVKYHNNNVATGFVVSNKHVLTAYHTYYDTIQADPGNWQEDVINNTLLEFNRPDMFKNANESTTISIQTTCKAIIDFSPTIGKKNIDVDNDHLDYMLLEVSNMPPNIKPIQCPEKVDAQIKKVNIIHHPGGSNIRKLSARRNNVCELLNYSFSYKTNTLEGSSGAPLFDDDWNWIGLHKGAEEKLDANNDNIKVNYGVGAYDIWNRIKQYCYIELIGYFDLSDDNDKQLEFCERAAEEGNIRAQYSLGYLYEYGILVDRNLEEAIEWYKAASKIDDDISSGDADAQYQLGLLYETGVPDVLEQDLDKAFMLYQRSSKTVNLDANILSQDFEKAYKLHLQSSNGHNLDAMMHVAKFFEYGVGRDVDHKQALGLYQLAAKYRHPPALYKLGYCYENKRLVNVKSISRAKRKYERATEFYYPPAYYAMARVNKNIQRAKWLNEAIELGHPSAMLEMGRLYRNGYSNGEIEQNPHKYLRLFAKATQLLDNKRDITGVTLAHRLVSTGFKIRSLLRPLNECLKGFDINNIQINTELLNSILKQLNAYIDSNGYIVRHQSDNCSAYLKYENNTLKVCISGIDQDIVNMEYQYVYNELRNVFLGMVDNPALYCLHCLCFDCFNNNELIELSTTCQGTPLCPQPINI